MEDLTVTIKSLNKYHLCITPPQQCGQNIRNAFSSDSKFGSLAPTRVHEVKSQKLQKDTKVRKIDFYHTKSQHLFKIQISSHFCFVFLTGYFNLIMIVQIIVIQGHKP